MSKENRKDELPELPELPDDSLPELPELPDEPLPELPPEPIAEEVKPVPPPEPVPAPEPAAEEPATEPVAFAPEQAAASVSMEDAPLRELKGTAPEHLRTAALIVLVGCLLPWLSLEITGPMTWAGAKLLILAGIWLLWQSVELRAGGKVPGIVTTLGGIVLGKKPEEVDPAVAARRAKNRKGPAKLEVPFPTGLHVLGFLLAIVGIIFPMIDPGASKGSWKAMAELGMLAWAGGTWVHIYAYERWGSFNPLFPLMFIGMLFSGGLNAVGFFTGAAGTHLVGLIGGLTVAAGGGLAAYTIIEAMMEAKKEGEAKKAIENDRRKAARDARKSK
ncbi:MAG: hypothetical protein P1V81_14370 [Planctomycetota bacterium]|nr:hypothetical protein [Planctomycetota bacterium]